MEKKRVLTKSDRFNRSDFRNDKTWTQENVDKVLKTNINTEILIKPTIPVYITYFTAWVDVKGNLNFRDDIYNLDNELAKEIFEEQ